MSFFEGIPCNAIAYIGLSAVDEASVASLVAFLRQRCLDKQISRDFIVGLGFLITHIGLRATRPPSSRQVTPQQLGRILKDYHVQLFTIAHYVPSRQLNLEQEVGQMTENWIESYPDAIQINTDCEGKLPAPADLEKIRRRYPFGRRIILPITRSIIGSSSGRSSQLSRILNYIAPYKDIITAVLIDSSEGTGEDTDANWAGVVIREINRRFPALSIGVAGGFRPENVTDKLRGIIETNLCSGDTRRLTIPFSIDAQSGLRETLQIDSKRGVTDTRFSVTRAMEYITDAVAVFRHYL
jgi:phosphoribosylanthranilate isomerase